MGPPVDLCSGPCFLMESRCGTCGSGEDQNMPKVPCPLQGREGGGAMPASKSSNGLKVTESIMGGAVKPALFVFYSHYPGGGTIVKTFPSDPLRLSEVQRCAWGNWQSGDRSPHGGGVSGAVKEQDAVGPPLGQALPHVLCLSSSGKKYLVNSTWCAFPELLSKCEPPPLSPPHPATKGKRLPF